MLKSMNRLSKRFFFSHTSFGRQFYCLFDSSDIPNTDANMVVPTPTRTTPERIHLDDLPTEATESNLADNYDMDGSNSDDYTLSDKMVHFCGGHVTREHWAACKVCIIFMAGCLVTRMSTSSKEVMESNALECYCEVIAELDQMHFDENARAFFLAAFRKNDGAMTGHSVYRYYQDSRNKMRSIVVPLLPASFMTMKSGRGFHDTCNNIIVEQFRKELVKGTKNVPAVSRECADQMTPPMFWEYQTLPWRFLLCVKIFRRHPHLAPDVPKVLADVSNKTESRAIVKHKAQVAKYKKRKNAAIKKEVGVVSTAENAAAKNKNEKQQVWAKVHMAKAMEESSNVQRKLGEIEAHEKNLNLLDRLRDVIGEEVYLARVRSLFATIAEPTKAFAKECEVVVIDDDDDSIDDCVEITSVSTSIVTNVLPPTSVNTKADDVSQSYSSDDE